MEGKKGRMARVYSAPGQKTSTEKVKKGDKTKDPAKGKTAPKTPRMGD